jgi:hypothetical protein
MFALPPLLFLVSLLAAALGWGAVCLRLLGRKPRRDPLYLLSAAAVGLGVVAYLTLALGLVGLLRPVLLGSVLVAGIGAGLRLLPGPLRRHATAADPDVASDHPAGKWAAAALWVYLAGLALLTLLSAFRPVDGLDWDSLSYHLAAPKIYLQEGRIPFIAYDSHTHFPFTLEMLYTLGLQFGGTSGAKLVHWACGWLTALVLVVWTGRLRIGGVPAPRWCGPLAAAAFVSMPVVLWEMGTAYIDLGTALFQMLALCALIDAVAADSGGVRVDPQGAALAGVLSGFALGTKYTALLQFGLLGLGLMWVLTRTAERGTAWRALFAFGLLGVLVASPWYVKNWLWTHNPVYPFFYRFFPQSFSWTSEAERAYAGEQYAFGLGKGPVEAIQLFWNLAFHGRAFYINQRTLMGDKLGSLGALWVGLLPLVLWTRGLDRKVHACLGYGLASVGLWFLLSQQVRYLSPVFASLAVVVAAAAAAVPEGLLRRAAGVFSGLVLLLNLQMHLPVAQASWALATGELDREQFLDQSLPGLYEACSFANANLLETSRIALYQEARGFYLDRRYFWANPLQHNMIPYDSLGNGQELIEVLRRFQITHVLINRQFLGPLRDTQWYRLLDDGMRRGLLQPVFESRAPNPEQRVVIYRIATASGQTDGPAVGAP